MMRPPTEGWEVGREREKEMNLIGNYILDGWGFSSHATDAVFVIFCGFLWRILAVFRGLKKVRSVVGEASLMMTIGIKHLLEQSGYIEKVSKRLGDKLSVIEGGAVLISAY